MATPTLAPEGGGPIGTCAWRTAGAWARAGHEVTVFAPAPLHGGGCSDRLEVEPLSPGLTRVRWGPEYVADARRRLAGPALASWQCAAAVAARRQAVGPPDALEVQAHQGLGYFLLMRQRTLDPLLQGFPIGVAVHAPPWLVDPLDQAPMYRLPRYWAGEMERASLAAAAGVVVASQPLLDQLAPLVAEVPRLVVPPPLADDDGPLIPPSGSAAAVLAEGTLARHAGSLDLLMAMRVLWDEGWAVPLEVLGGSGWHHPQRQSMQAYLEHAYLPYVQRGLVQFRGETSGEAAAAVVQAAGVAVVPALLDTNPYALLGAMARGQVVVATDGGLARDLVRSGDNGILVPAGSPGALADGIRAALTMPAGRRRAMGQRAAVSARAAAGAGRVAAAKADWYRELAQRDHPRHFPFVAPVRRRAPPPAAAPRLTAVVPHYNLGEYLEEAIHSVLASTVVPDEILVVDDDSSDPASIARLYHLQARYPQVGVVRVPHGGPAPTRNAGARLAHGQFVAFVDADDRVDPRYFERALEIFAAYDNVSMVCAWVAGCGAREELWPTWTTGSPYALFQNVFSYSSMVVRRDALLADGLGDPTFVHGMEDWEAGVGLLLAGHGGVAIPEPLYQYRLRAGSRSRGANPARMLDQYRRIVAKHRVGLTPHLPVLAGLLNANGPQYGANHPTEPAAWVQQELAESSLAEAGAAERRT